MIIVRPVDQTNLEQVIDMAALMHAESRSRTIPFDASFVRGLLAAMAAAPDRAFTGVSYLSHDGEPTGMLIAELMRYSFSALVRSADIGFYVLPEHRNGVSASALIASMEEWAAARGAIESYLGSMSLADYERVGRFYQSRGYRPVGSFYSKRLDGQARGIAA